MKKQSLPSAIAHSLFRKKRPSESILKYLFFLTHLWSGLIVGGVLCFMCLTGAAYIFKDEIQDFSSRDMIQREAPATVQIATAEVIANFTEVYGSEPTSIVYAEDQLQNLRVIGGNHNSIKAFADRETGEILGEVSPGVQSFFSTVFRLHRWFSLGGDNRKIGQAITGACTLTFLFLLISGLILWLPKFGKKNPFKNKFSLRFSKRFTVWNRDVHINLGAILTLLFIVIAWSGIFFSYNWVRTLTVDSFKPASERVEGGNQHGHAEHGQGKPGEMRNDQGRDMAEGKPGEMRNDQGRDMAEGKPGEMRNGQGRDMAEGKPDEMRNGQGRDMAEGKPNEMRNGQGRDMAEGKPGEMRNDQGRDMAEGRTQTSSSFLSFPFDRALAQANKQLTYTGDVTLMLSGRGITSPTVRKENTHNLFGAQFYDDVTFSSKGKFLAVNRFSDKAFHAQLSSQMKAIHMGSILGLKSKILYFLLCLIGAYLPISGYVMWWKRLNAKKNSTASM